MSITKGILDGNGFAIKNVFLNSTSHYTGLFSYAVEATFKNVKLINFNVSIESTDSSSSSVSVGSLIGVCQYCVIENITINGTLPSFSRVAVYPSSTNLIVGGLVGTAYYSTIKNVIIENTMVYVPNSNYVGSVAG